MSDSQIKIGIDYRGSLFYAARVDFHTGRPEIKALARFDKLHTGRHIFLKGSKIIISVPDYEITLKKLLINHDETDIEMRVRFELAQTLLEDENDFYFDAIPAGRNNHYLGLVARKKQIKSLAKSFFDDNNDSPINVACQMRAAALAKGYLNFCRSGGVGLVCLVDFNGRLASIAFIFQNKIIDLACLSLEKYKRSLNEEMKKIAIELKTIINYKLTSFLEDGITTPLSAMVLMGNKVNQETISVLKEYFPVEINLPQINMGFFSGQTNLAKIPLEKYLVALGLVVN